MKTIQTEQQYNAACEKIEALLQVVGNETPVNDPNFIELNILSDLVADYEELNYPISASPVVKSQNTFAKLGRVAAVF
ncbi:MAG: hypothetical protein LBN93_11990 [Candidatus Symbiothrix sp.]|jgi:HTH-type transcriptional regulator/antitoxin HigA|nr:hypothetical protein [Candidatus Symbiothrix sp.]